MAQFDFGCHHPLVDSKRCFHYFREDALDTWKLLSDAEIKKIIEENYMDEFKDSWIWNHIKDITRKPEEQCACGQFCRNWDYFTPDEKNQLKEKEPQSNPDPVSKDRVNIRKKIIVGEKDLTEVLVDRLNQDCYAVYSRNPKDYNTLRVFFNYRKGKSSDSIKAHDELVDRPEILVNLLKSGMDVVIIWGEENSIDSYFLLLIK